MLVKFKSFGLLRRIIGTKLVEIEVPEQSSVRDVIDNVLKKWGDPAKQLIIDNEKISGNLIVMLNMRDVDTLDGVETIVKENDEVAVLPHVQGG